MITFCRLCAGGELSGPSLEDDLENSLQDEDNCFEDGRANCKNNSKNNPHNNKSSPTKSRQGSGPAPAGGRDKIAEIGRFSAKDGASPAPVRVNEGRRVDGGNREGSPGSTAAASRPRQGKEIQALSGTKATAVVRRPVAAAADRADEGAAAVLAARDDRQMEEFRAAKHFNCTGREPGLYADVNTGCKVSCTLQRKSEFMCSISGNCAASTSPNFYIHVSVSDLYIPRIGGCSKIGLTCI